MSLYDHYLEEDREQLDANLILMHKALINILESTADANFKTADNSLEQFGKSYQVVKALHVKKVNQKENEMDEYMRRHYF